jgi:hypothetical protein
MRGFSLSELVATYPLMISRETVVKQGDSVTQNLSNAIRQANS